MMKYALLTNNNNYVGREYARALVEAGISFDVLEMGQYPERSETEDERCNNLWNPPLMRDVVPSDRVFHFNSLTDISLVNHIEQKAYKLGIQGGVGVLKKDVIQAFKLGILNFHPGDLPAYRGCSAPEWQLYEGKAIICTCHLVDEGIDSGKIYIKKELFASSIRNYHQMRASIYPKIARFMVETIYNLSEDFKELCYEQNENDAIYRRYIGDEQIKILIERME